MGAARTIRNGEGNGRVERGVEIGQALRRFARRADEGKESAPRLRDLIVDEALEARRTIENEMRLEAERMREASAWE